MRIMNNNKSIFESIQENLNIEDNKIEDNNIEDNNIEDNNIEDNKIVEEKLDNKCTLSKQVKFNINNSENETVEKMVENGTENGEDDITVSNINEQDTTVKITTSLKNDRQYSIVDITELNKVSDGDVQPPIDITGLLVEIDSRLSESNVNWGQINIQSTRINSNNDSNALFELSTGSGTYLMSMILEENATVLKINNTKGQNIFKRRSNDMKTLVESYIKQFIPNNKDEDTSEIIKHINEELRSRVECIRMYIDLYKKEEQDNKEQLEKFISNKIYSLVAEISDSIKSEEPNYDEKLELPSFDSLVEQIFGKEWINVKEDKTIEIEGTEKLEESEEIPEKEELDTMTDPKQGLGTGYAAFARKPLNLDDLDNKSKYFSSGDSSYIIVSKEKLSKDEFNTICDNFLSPNEYCKQFEPLDVENYAYNVIEFYTDENDYSILVDPSGYDYCRYVAKIKRGK